MTDLVRYRKWFFAIAGLYLVPALALLLIPLIPGMKGIAGPSLRAGIDFTGGTAMSVEFTQAVERAAIRSALENAGQSSIVVQSTGPLTYFVRMGELQPAQVDQSGNVTVIGDRERIETALNELSPMDVRSLDAISPIIGGETIRGAIIAVIFASLGALLYITWAFRRVQNPFRYGVVTVIALLHDVIAVLGVFSLLGKILEVEVDAMFITGVLTVIGYSVNDSIVVLDRLRENLLRHPGFSISDMVNLSIRETLARSLNTSLTTLLIVIVLLLFGGPTIRPLLLVLLVGIAVGAYSSIFIASFLLAAWEQGEIGRFFRRLRFSRPAQ